jgi:hypothetical protein
MEGRTAAQRGAPTNHVIILLRAGKNAALPVLAQKARGYWASFNSADFCPKTPLTEIIELFLAIPHGANNVVAETD